MRKKRPAFWDQWLNRRLPSGPQQTLHYRSIFILPTKEGLTYLIMVIFMWLLGTNYQNNLVLACSYLLLSLMAVCILHTYHNLSGISLSLLKAESGFVEGMAEIHFKVESQSGAEQYSIACFFDQDLQQVVDKLQEKSAVIIVPLHLAERGYCKPGRMTVETRYPLGLIRAWSHLDFDIRVLAYPKPIACNLQPVLAEIEGTGARVQKKEGSAEFAGLRDYQSGDSPKRIAWKHYSRTEQLATKLFEDDQNHALFFRWDQLSGLDVEQRLSHLCFCVNQLSDHELVGLDLPGESIAPGSGPIHRSRLLTALALFKGAGGD